MVNSLIKVGTVSILLLSLTGCGQREGFAPVVELNWRAGNTHAVQYVVRRGDTLYAIAFRYDEDYRQLAIANHLYSPYALRIGQVIQLKSQNRVVNQPRHSVITQKKYVRQQPTTYTKPVFSWHSSRWLWPAQGRVVANFVPEQGKKGIDIAGNKGDKIHAASSGIVAYSGSGLSGYGNLIIIKHDNQYLTAYGNNERNLVREGQSIKAGQVIADMGLIDRRFWGVHFEIRQSGKPVNPLSYLQPNKF